MKERIIELVNGELDGTNSSSEHTELTTLLDREPSAKALFDEMEKVDQLLATVPMIDPPATLKSRVMNAIAHQEAPARVSSQSWLERILAPLVQRPAWAAVYAFTIGIVVGLGVVTVVDSSGPEPAMVRGTIGDVQAPPLGRTHVVAGTATADVSVSALDDELRIDVTITSSDPATLRLAAKGQDPIVIESPSGAPVYSLLIPKTASVSIELISNEASDRALLTIDGSTEQ